MTQTGFEAAKVIAGVVVQAAAAANSSIFICRAQSVRAALPANLAHLDGANHNVVPQVATPQNTAKA